jgi:hypothetical protein
LSFKSFVQQDLEAIFSADEFEEAHLIDGKAVLIMVDNDRLQERSKKEYDGLSVGEILYFVGKTAFQCKPAQCCQQVFDGKQMQVFDVREDFGLYEIILTQNRA